MASKGNELYRYREDKEYRKKLFNEAKGVQALYKEYKQGLQNNNNND